jgi:hypothetical protein
VQEATLALAVPLELPTIQRHRPLGLEPLDRVLVPLVAAVAAPAALSASWVFASIRAADNPIAQAVRTIMASGLLSGASCARALAGGQGTAVRAGRSRDR